MGLVDTSCGKELGQLQTEVVYRANLQRICHKIYGAKNIDEIILTLEKDITSLFQAQRLTIYRIDGVNWQLVSRFKSGEDIQEIRIPVSTQSIAGHAAFKQTLVQINNVRNKKELHSIDPELRFDDRFDKQSGFKTRQVLAYPIIFQTFLLGAVQIINRKNGDSFSKLDEEGIKELSKMLGIAFYTQKRIEKGVLHKYTYLLENNIVTHSEMQRARDLSRKSEQTIEDFLVKKMKISKRVIGTSLSQFYKVPFVDSVKAISFPKNILQGITPAFMRRNVWVPISLENNWLKIAIDNPNDLPRIDQIRALFPGKLLRFCVALQDDILKMIDDLIAQRKKPPGIDEIIQRMSIDAKHDVSIEHEYHEKDSAMIQLVNKTIMDALEHKASDIHIEPSPGNQPTLIRFRVDGNCHTYRTIPASYRHAVISRIKVMADLDIAERRRPQDGKINFKKFSGKPVELRVATIPTQGGVEDAILRIVSSGRLMEISQLNFSATNYERILDAISMPYGIIFVCGPTGSGKTTTLHAVLKHINQGEKKIWTAEDPVEITQKGLRQVQVRQKINFGFKEALRAFLRADPDVIMVGEMRDKETTQIGIEASLTGHLVLSTLHTNNAPESVARLLDLGMDPFNFADAILCVLAQRLVLTLCDKCKKPYTPSVAEFDTLVHEYGKEAFERHIGIFYNKDIKLYRNVGCNACNHTGYSGRMGLHELLVGTDKVKKMIQTKRCVDDIRHQAICDGMTTLKQDGISKILLGKCDLFQVRKVCIK